MTTATNSFSAPLNAWLVDGVRPDRYDLTGATLVLCGARVIVAGHWARN